MRFAMVLERMLEPMPGRQVPRQFLAGKRSPFFGRSTRRAFDHPLLGACSMYPEEQFLT